MIWLLIHALLDPEKEQDEAVEGSAGAYVSCWVDFDHTEGAEVLAQHYIREAGFLPLKTEEMKQPTLETYSNDEQEGLQYFQEAVEHGYCLSFHLYPPEE